MPNESQNASAPPYDDEISLTDILLRLWRGRGIIVLITALAVGIAVVIAVVTAVQTNRLVTYFIDLRGIENGAYPNGAEFAPRQLVGPEVLARLREQFDIPGDISLSSNIVVTYSSQIADGIARSYRERLSAGDLTSAEIEAINEEFRREMRQALQSSVQIDVHFAPMGLDADTGRAIARAIPDIWADIYSTQFRIFEDRRLAGTAVSRSNEPLDTAASTLVAHQRVRTMETGLDIMAGDNRLSLLQTSDGVSVEELDQEVERFRTLYFNGLMSSGIGDDDGVGSIYLADLRLQIADLERRVAAYDRSIQQVRDIMAAGRVPDLDQRPSPGEDQGDSIQLGESGLGQIVDLAERASMTTFIQNILSQKQETAFRISQLRRELASVDLEFASTSAAGFRDEASAMLSRLTASYAELLEMARQRVRAQLGELYSPASAPTVTGNASLVSPRNVLIIGVAGVMGGMIAVVAVLVWSAVAGRRREESA